MISRVYEQVLSSSLVDQVVVATDDQRIFDHVQSFGGEVVMTRDDHPSGTDRVAEAAAHYPSAEIVINVQGDEPFIDPRQIDQLIKCFETPSVEIATLAHRIEEERSLLSPNVVKVVFDKAGRALYFSRHGIPYLRDVPVGQWLRAQKHYQHLGLYAYRVKVLAQLATMEKTDLENAESLEQLRWLENGLNVQVSVTDMPAFGIDTPADLLAAELRFNE